MLKRSVLQLAFACVLILIVQCSCALAQVSMEASVGYDQTTLNGRWFPLEVQMKNDGNALEGVLSVDLMQTYDEYDRYEYPIKLDAGEEASVRFPISTLVTQRIFSVSLYVNGERIAQTLTSAASAVEDDALLIGVLGEEQVFAESLCISDRNDVLDRGEMITALCIDEAFMLMSDQELDAFQVLFVGGFDLDTLEEAKQEQLDAWVMNGGVIIYGPDADAEWLKARSGIAFDGKATSSDLVQTLLTHAGAASEPTDTVFEICPLLPESSCVLFDAAGHALMAEVPYGNGLILTMGFALSDVQLRSQLMNNALLQRILIACERLAYEDLFIGNHRANYSYGSSLNEAQLLSEGISILPVAAVLTVYVMFTGVGLFVLLRGQDRSKLLWLFLPVTAIAGVITIAVIAGVLNLDAPTAASFRVTKVDETGVVSSEERALIAYPDQTRVTISAENGAGVERMEYGYFYGNAETDANTKLRDTITLGAQPSLEMSAVAPWLARNLVVKNEAVPEGVVTGTAWMESDGLHAQIKNDTNIDLKNAVLLTSLGFTDIGDIASGEEVAASIKSPEQIMKNPEGDQAILEGELLAYPVSLSSINWGKVYPQAQTDPDFVIDEGGEHHAQLVQRLKLNLASNVSSSLFTCVLYAETPQLACAQLYKDGEAITRSVQESILSANLTFETVGRTGVFYYPQGTFAAHDVAFAGKAPVLGKETEKRYADLGEDAVFGFDLSSIDYHNTTEIRIASDYYKPEKAVVNLQVYDYAADEWISLRDAEQAELDSTLIGRVISDEGHLFIRYTSADGDACTVYLPKIIVEGSVGV